MFVDGIHNCVDHKNVGSLLSPDVVANRVEQMCLSYVINIFLKGIQRRLEGVCRVCIYRL